MSELQAVLFDMDGTLCDTEPAWMAAEVDMAARYGASWNRDDGLQLVGNDLRDSGIYIVNRMQLSLSPEEVVAELIAAVIATVQSEGVTWRPGAVELLAQCNAAGLPTAMVTMSYADLAGVVVEALPRGRFLTVVTGEDVEFGKPAPDAYLLAAERLGVDPAACVAIEDSATGAQAAEAAGCVVLAVPHHVPIPAGRRRHQLDSLAGCTVEVLRELAAASTGNGGGVPPNSGHSD
jgi:HAD superfamily hydrolase (TIGR01509 family)